MAEFTVSYLTLVVGIVCLAAILAVFLPFAPFRSRSAATSTVFVTFMLLMVLPKGSGTGHDGGLAASQLTKDDTTQLIGSVGPWTKEDACRMAVKAYFFLDEPPIQVTETDGLTGFRSEAGYHYKCRIVRDRAELRWVNKQGEAMTSDSTRVGVTASTEGQELLVSVEDMGASSFMAVRYLDGV
jgi:hypothetical protein